NVNLFGSTGSRLVVSNTSANFSLLVSSLNGTQVPTLNFSNIENMVSIVRRFGLADFQIFPYYRNYNDVNDFNNNPRQFIANVFLAKTNRVVTSFADPDNYNNEYTRGYAINWQNSEIQGVGSSITTFLNLGQSNAFFADGV